MNWAQAAPYIILAAVITVPGWQRLLATLRAARRARHEDHQAPAPAASPPPVPANPGAGARPPQAAGPPGSPGTGPSIYGRCTMAVFFYDTGITVTWDHQRRRRLIDIPPADEWHGSGFLKDTNDQH